MELIAKDLQAFILKQSWASVSLDGQRGNESLPGGGAGREGELAGDVPL